MNTIKLKEFENLEITYSEEDLEQFIEECKKTEQESLQEAIERAEGHIKSRIKHNLDTSFHEAQLAKWQGMLDDLKLHEKDDQVLLKQEYRELFEHQLKEAEILRIVNAGYAHVREVQEAGRERRAKLKESNE